MCLFLFVCLYVCLFVRLSGWRVVFSVCVDFVVVCLSVRVIGCCLSFFLGVFISCCLSVLLFVCPSYLLFSFILVGLYFCLSVC